jgi:pyruvate/2-oxoglutarate dehydrogenase complex dihydrolipoamide dehydrogenase (E3) component
VIGDALRSRIEGRRTTEVAIAVASLNRMMELGRPEYAPLTNVEALELDRLPDHLVAIGGGYVGLEPAKLAQAYRRFGSGVTKAAMQ